MNKNEVIKTLAEFFMSEFENDAMGVSDWLAQSGQDADEFVAMVQNLKKEND